MSEWAAAPLARLVAFQKGRKVETAAQAQPGYERYLGASGIQGLSDGYAATAYAVTAKQSDVLMLWDGERSGLVGHGQSGVVASTVSRLTPDASVDPTFLYFALAHQFEWIQNRRTGSGVPHVPKELGRILVVHHPKNKETQRRIAAILTSLDTAIEKTEALIEKHQQIKAGLMHDLFTRGVLPNGQLRPPREQAPELYQATPLGWLPREWNVAKTGDLCSFITKGTTPARDDMWQGQEGIRFLRVDNLTFDGQFDFIASSYRISARTHTTSLSRSRCVAGDVLMNIVGPPLGKVAHVTQSVGEVNINQAIAVFRPKAELSAPFLMRWLTSDGAKRWIGQRAKQTSGQLNVTLAMCQDLLIPHMSSDEQQLIGSRIQCDEGFLQSELARLAKMRAQKLGLMQVLLTGKVPVTGEVGIAEPTDA